MRGVVISFDEKPENWNEYDTGLWFRATDFKNVAECIKVAIRMRPDELVIKQECFGTFNIT